MYVTIKPKKGCSSRKLKAFYTVARWRKFYNTQQTPRSVDKKGGVRIPMALLPNILTNIHRAMSSTGD